MYEEPCDLFTDVMPAMGSLIVYSLFRAVVNSVLQKTSPPSPARSYFTTLPFPGLVRYAIVPAAREELVIRGFVIRLVFSLTKNRAAAVPAATCTDFFLFLSYGVLPLLRFAAGQLVLLLYFLRTGQLMPAVPAHIVLNLVFVAQLPGNRL